MTRSDDDGATWSAPADLSAAIKKPNWTWYATGPGHGIQLASGRLIIPCCHTVAVNMKADDPEYAHVIYSDDGGKSWHLGGEVGPGCDEPAVVELPDGRIYLNSRNPLPSEVGHRAYAFSRDGGLTFSPRQVDAALIEPTLWGGCQGSLVLRRRSNGEGATPKRCCSSFGGASEDTPKQTALGGGTGGTAPEGDTCVLFANPATDANERKNMAVRVSGDDCRTWSAPRVLHAGPAAYSDITVLPDGTILCLYEGGDENPYQTLRLASFDLAWLFVALQRN